MKVALIHDHLTQYGGAERVLEVLQSIYPEAPTFTLLYKKETFGDIFAHRDIRPSFLQYIPFIKHSAKWSLPLMPTATENYNLDDFDVVISSASAFAKGVITKPETVHICYCHTPTRYLWTDAHSYLKNIQTFSVVKTVLQPILTLLRIWDFSAAQRVDHFIANSHTVAMRIKKYYRKESTVIYPPVDVHNFSLSSKQKKYFLAGGRLVDYKRFDLVIEAFNKTGLPLVIFGSGPMEKVLKKQARENITFLGRVSDKRRIELFEDAIAFIHPQEEDFGITPIESMAAGRPVIAFKKGGATETIIDGITGEFFLEQTWASLAHTLLHFKEEQFNPKKIREHAEHYSAQRFRKELKEFIQDHYEDHKRTHLGEI